MTGLIVVAAMTLGELFGSAAGSNSDQLITNLVSDSRAVVRGDAFVALAGARTHGLAHAAEAVERGAVAVIYEPSADWPEPSGVSIAVPGLESRLGELAQRFYARAHWPDNIVGVTGTNGKTSVAWFVAQAEAALGRRSGYVGTLGYGTPGALESHKLTTPDSLTLHREIAALDAETVALEVSSHALAQDRIAGLKIDTAVFTNLSRDHLDAHGSLEQYGEIKASLLQRPGVTAAVMNIDDPFVAGLRPTLMRSVRQISVSRNEPATIRGRIVEHSLRGMHIALSGDCGEAELRSTAIGEFNADNLLAALGALVALGRQIEPACRALESAAVPPGRMEVIRSAGGTSIIVDYAHTPDALARALDAVAFLTAGQLTCVFGCGGERDRGKRAQMGRVAAERADRIVLTNDNPRGEDPDRIIADIQQGLGDFDAVDVEPDRKAAIERAIAAAGPGDAVLIAGRGHETTQYLTTGERRFNDREVVLAALGGVS